MVDISDIYGLASVTPARATSDDARLRLRVARGGELYIADYFESLAAEGRIFGANMGTVTTPITFLATAANRPDAWLRVPSGTTILPLGVNIAFDAMAGTANEIDIRSAENDIGDGTSSAASILARRHRTDGGITSAVVARQLATGDTTAETNPLSLFRHTAVSVGTAIDTAVLHVNREMLGYPVLVGPASLILYVASTTTQATGFVVFTWAEVPSTVFTG